MNLRFKNQIFFRLSNINTPKSYDQLNSKVLNNVLFMRVKGFNFFQIILLPKIKIFKTIIEKRSDNYLRNKKL